ncbi:MAG TPA: LamG-like jellyroll fold domain-containing protein, partial [Verrucomicrobiae bacterium]|nr:LamG-like jellyroll fold domain-containing protein [Verrucomicrobiae bacterium]
MKTFALPFYPKTAVLLVLSLSLNSMPAASLREGLVSFWPLETADGGVTPDLASGNTMSIVGNASVAPGQRGNAFTFDGTTSYLLNSHTPDNSITGLPIYTAGGYSISMWVKGAPQTARYLFSEGSTTSNNPLLILQTGQAATNNAKFDVIIRNDASGAAGTPVNHVVSTNIVFDDTWHHIAWVDDRGSAKLYIDGNLDPANFSYTPVGVYTFNTTVIGTLVRAAVQNAYFLGQIDDVAIWDRALTQAEVQEMMTNGVTVSPLFVSRQPVGGTAGLGDRFTFNARGGGEQPVTYQWFKGGAEILDATASSLTLTNITAADAGSYTVQISNPSGTIMSEAAVLTVRPDPAPELRAGLVSYWPMDEMVADGQGNKTEDLYSHNDFRLFTAGFFDQTTGAFGPAILFNGTDQYGLRNGGFPVYNNSAFTVSLWINAGPQADTR